MELIEFPNVSEHFICNCGHHSRCHAEGGRCDHRSCWCLIFDPDRNARMIVAAKLIPEMPQLQPENIPETDRWLERKDLE